MKEIQNTPNVATDIFYLNYQHKLDEELEKKYGENADEKERLALKKIREDDRKKASVV